MKPIQPISDTLELPKLTMKAVKYLLECGDITVNEYKKYLVNPEYIPKLKEEYEK